MKTIIILMTLLWLTACKEPKPVSWYVDHPEEMRAKINECNEDISRYLKDGDCANASKAWDKRFFAPAKANKKNDSPGLYPLQQGADK